MERPALTPESWRGRRVLITGHTGFKGAWLALWLHRLGAEVTGYAYDPPTDPSLFEQAGVGRRIASVRGDVADVEAITAATRAAEPEIVFHLAAQAIVRAGYADPVGTYRTNVVGTAATLQAACDAGAGAVVVVTSDKSYENRGWPWGYRETDRLGGHDPYSSSKAAAELVTSAWRSSFGGSTLIASARAGNVIGGGDYAADRLLPDLTRAAVAGRAVRIRRPDAVRPWQHVLDCLQGYLLLGQRLLDGDVEAATAWNFGPPGTDVRSVRAIADRFAAQWPGSVPWEQDGEPGPHEAEVLRLDSSRALKLGWRPVLDVEQAIDRTVGWYRAVAGGADPERAADEELVAYGRLLEAPA